ncbi:MAG: hypothetical protein OCC49_19975, partial [Fibrobacterales bacterium]
KLPKLNGCTRLIFINSQKSVLKAYSVFGICLIAALPSSSASKRTVLSGVEGFFLSSFYN